MRSVCTHCIGRRSVSALKDQQEAQLDFLPTCSLPSGEGECEIRLSQWALTFPVSCSASSRRRSMPPSRQTPKVSSSWILPMLCLEHHFGGSSVDEFVEKLATEGKNISPHPLFPVGIKISDTMRVYPTMSLSARNARHIKTKSWQLRQSRCSYRYGATSTGSIELPHVPAAMPCLAFPPKRWTASWRY
jgi:hypothetical protein